ncbi:MAG: CBS domain-containing protein [Chloroflexota bacterium]|nr:MAG: CBS domain-containing protein [Chloroflexota bacterium]
MTSTQEQHGRKGRVVTDQNAKDITRVEELAYDLKVQEVMSRDIKVVTADMQMEHVLEQLRTEHISGLPVVEGDEMIGIISLEDLIRSMCAADLQAPISKYMSPEVIAINTYDPVVEALELFTKFRVGRLPVVDENGKLQGMITKGDITRGVLIALQKDYQEEEVRRYRASHLFEDINSDRTSLILRYRIKAQDFIHGGNASSNIKRALLRLGANPQIARRCGIAIYEAEMNQIIHTTDGGIIRVEIEPHRILMQAIDEGPGIDNINLAMQVGFSTATEEIRELGFGAGMGLNNIQRCVDKMILESEIGKGTKLEMKIYLQPEESFREVGHFDEDKTSHESTRNHR